MKTSFGMSSPADQPMQQYGSAGPLTASKARTRRPFRINFAAILLCIFLPWVIFCVMYALMSFSIHYNSKSVCYLLVFLCLGLVAVLMKTALDSSKDPMADPSTSTWSTIIAACCALGWLCGVTAGDINFFHNMEPYYDGANLNSYPNVDPSQMPGQQVMDAGQMYFVPGTRLDTTKAMAFHNLDTYCVAPIVNGQMVTKSYDFWAVGMNCCSSRTADNYELVGLSQFGCGEYNNPKVLSGLRVMRQDQVEFYRLAVKQAESAHTIKANHPLFFHWMLDPDSEVSAYMDEGFKYYVFGVFAFFAFMFFTVICCVVCLSRS